MQKKKWTIDHGDYIRDSKSTNAHEKQLRLRKIRLTIGKVFIVVFIIALLSLIMTF